MATGIDTSFLSRLGINEINHGASAGTWMETSGETIDSISPIDAQIIASVRLATLEDYERVMHKAQEAFPTWRMVPAPQRGEIVRQLGNLFRKHKSDLGKLISYEMGKMVSEGEGEVQEIIDIADFAVGLSRQLYGKTMHSERPSHRMYEQWHPLGTIGIISAFNFPGAVWAWNACIAAVCGDTMVWKPSPITPLTAIAIQNMCNEIMQEHDIKGVFNLVVGDVDPVGNAMIQDRRLPLISATGSCRMGREVGQAVAKRLGRTLLELGGNNALIVMDDANLGLALPAAAFGAAGTSGQRCTTTRRLFLQRGIYEKFTQSLVKAYSTIRIGNPLEEGILMGPLVSQQAVDQMMAALKRARDEGGEILFGGKALGGPGYYVEPTIVRAPQVLPASCEETFAPILYVTPFDTLEEALQLQNNVDQGLSSSIFTSSLVNAETFLSHMGSDCGIANVNIGTSGAEIGGAFGGEKDTGGGREAGSDSWKAYMRRQTNTINWGSELPLAQGVRFDLGEPS